MNFFWKRRKTKEFHLATAVNENKALTAIELKQIIQSTEKDIIFLCIGSDRYIADALGPLVGSKLQKNKSAFYHVYGTLDHPVHALNLEKRLKEINKKFSNFLLIAIDACMGEKQEIGKVIIEKGPLFPGKAMNNALAAVGDYHIKGIVSHTDQNDPDHFFKNVRLYSVMTTAQKVSALIMDCTVSQQKRSIEKNDSG